MLYRFLPGLGRLCNRYLPLPPPHLCPPLRSPRGAVGAPEWSNESGQGVQRQALPSQVQNRHTHRPLTVPVILPKNYIFTGIYTPEAVTVGRPGKNLDVLLKSQQFLLTDSK